MAARPPPPAQSRHASTRDPRRLGGACALRMLGHAAWVLLQAFAGPRDPRRDARAQLERVVDRESMAALTSAVDAEALARTRRGWRCRATVVTWDDDDYPRALLELGFAPPVLFFPAGATPERPALPSSSAATNASQGHGQRAQLRADAVDAASRSCRGWRSAWTRPRTGRARRCKRITLAVVGHRPRPGLPARNRDLAHAIADRRRCCPSSCPARRRGR